MTLRGHNGPDGPEAVADLLTEVAIEELRSQFDSAAEADLLPGRLPLSRRKAERELARAMVRGTLRGAIGEPRSEILVAGYGHKTAARVVAQRAVKTFCRMRSLRYDNQSDRAYAARFVAKRAVNYICPTPYRVRPDLGLFGVNDSPGITLDAL
jgi:hypothetical protein